MRLLLNKLLVSQNGLRNLEQVPKMIEFVKAGGKYTRDALLAQSIIAETIRGIPPPIHIALMEDGQMVLHDGHHRAVSLFLGGRPYVENSEYEIFEYTYEDYTEPHPERGWFTPFDLATEVRKPDISRFKYWARRIYKRDGMDLLREFILTDREMYVEPRKIWTVAQLAEFYQRTYHDKAVRNNCTHHGPKAGSDPEVDGPAPADAKGRVIQRVTQDVPAP